MSPRLKSTSPSKCVVKLVWPLKVSALTKEGCTRLAESGIFSCNKELALKTKALAALAEPAGLTGLAGLAGLDASNASEEDADREAAPGAACSVCAAACALRPNSKKTRRNFNSIHQRGRGGAQDRAPSRTQARARLGCPAKTPLHEREVHHVVSPQS